MKKILVNALSIGIAVALATGLSACNRSADAGSSAVTSTDAGTTTTAPANDQKTAPVDDQYGKVVSVTPVHKKVNNPKQVCHDETVTHTAPPKDQHQLAGTAIGAVVGGLAGHQIGGGKGKTLATVAGAAAGGYAGNRIEKHNQHGTTTSEVVRKCSTVNNTSSKLVGYDVRYVYNGVTRTTRMDHDPGDRVKVQEGVTSVSDAH